MPAMVACNFNAMIIFCDEIITCDFYSWDVNRKAFSADQPGGKCCFGRVDVDDVPSACLHKNMSAHGASFLAAMVALDLLKGKKYGIPFAPRLKGGPRYGRKVCHHENR